MPPQPVTSRVLTIAEMFAEGAFVPANVQRDFQWRTSDGVTLFNDIDRTFTASSLAPQRDSATAERDPDAIEATGVVGRLDAAEEPLDHYALGTIVLCREGDRFAIYDGLQRLTTLTILICILRDLTTDPKLAQELDALVRIAEGPVRLSLNGRDATLSAQIQPRGEAIKRRRTATRTDMGLRIRKLAKAFFEKLKPWDASRRDGFARFLLSHVHVGVQFATDGRLARQMFVTTNTRGRPLDAIDLLKGQLTDIAGDDQSAARIVGHWNALRAQLGEQFSPFLHAVDMIERTAPQGSDCLNALADHLARHRGASGIEAFIASLPELAEHYLELTRVLAAPPVDRFTADIWRLNFFRWPQWRALALYWFSDFQRASSSRGPGRASRIEAAHRRFAALHRRCMGLVLAGLSIAARETIMARALAQAKAGSNPLAVTGALAFKQEQLTRVTEALRLPLTDIETRSTLVRWLESMLQGDVPPPYLREITVEHVLPRRPALDSDWRQSFDSIEDRFMACHTLGNLVALDKARNEKLKNAQFDEKIPVLLEAAREFRMLADIDPKVRWNKTLIDERTRRYAELARTYLDLPVSAA